MAVSPNYVAALQRLHHLTQSCSHLLRARSVGQSMEGRSLTIFAIGKEGAPRILVTSLMHGNEPAGVAIVIETIHRLCNLPNFTRLLDNREIILFPFVNPDGFANGMQRKNRRHTCDDPLRSGVDLNRNFGRNWKLVTDPCSEEFAGSAPFSEPETAAYRSVIEDWYPSVVLNFHSYGDFLTHPYNDGESLKEEAAHVFDILSRALNFSRSGPAPTVLGYSTNGESDDWVFGLFGIYSLSPEVGPESAGFFPNGNVLADIVDANFDRIVNTAWYSGAQLSVNIVGSDIILENEGLLDFRGYGWIMLEGCLWESNADTSSLVFNSDGSILQKVSLHITKRQRYVFRSNCFSPQDISQACALLDAARCSCLKPVVDGCDIVAKWIHFNKMVMQSSPDLRCDVALFLCTMAAVVYLVTRMIRTSRIFCKYTAESVSDFRFHICRSRKHDRVNL